MDVDVTMRLPWRILSRIALVGTILGIAVLALLERPSSPRLGAPKPIRSVPEVPAPLLARAASVEFAATVVDRSEAPDDTHHEELSGVASVDPGVRDETIDDETIDYEEWARLRRLARYREEGTTKLLTFHPTGEVEEISIVEGERNGLSRRFHKTGELKSEEQWSGDARNGLYLEYAETGVLVGEGMHADGEKTGAWTTWWPNGTKASHGFFQSGRRVGTWWFWGSDGVLDGTTSGYYVDGQLREAIAPAPMSLRTE